MATFLFDKVIFGPVWSRRLGESLGINLLPSGRKVCNFNCVYCECGITPPDNQQTAFPAVSEVCNLLKDKLHEMTKKNEYLDSITFAGNGEPTLHPEFDRIVNEVIKIRDGILPEVSIAVLSNATMIRNQNIFDTLLKVDLNILKLDSAIEQTLKKINCPKGRFEMSEIIDKLKEFKGKLIIQTLFLRGYSNGVNIDNTTDEEVRAWIKAIKSIGPESVMLYSLVRDTAVKELEPVSDHELNRIALLLKGEGIHTQVTP